MVVSLPKLKTHHWVGATLSMKNLFGIVPGAIYGWPKNILHWAGIPECIVDLHSILMGRFALVDGIDGMEGNGPIQGTRVAAGVVIAGGYMPAVDATACRVMGIDPLQIPYLTSTLPSGDLSESAISRQVSRTHSVRKEFSLIPQFQYVRWKPGDHSAPDEGLRRLRRTSDSGLLAADDPVSRPLQPHLQCLANAVSARASVRPGHRAAVDQFLVRRDARRAFALSGKRMGEPDCCLRRSTNLQRRAVSAVKKPAARIPMGAFPHSRRCSATDGSIRLESSTSISHSASA